MTDKIVQQQVDFLDAALATVQKATQELKFDAGHAPSLFAVALHATLIELTRACLSLVTSGDTIGVLILMRSMQEALVDQTNLLSDTEYVKNMHSANLGQMARLLEEAAEKQNKLFKGLEEKWDVAKELADVRAQLKKFEDEERGELRIFRRFEMAGMEADYRSAYVLQCIDTHNNTTALVERHIDIGEDGRAQVSLFKEMEAGTLRARLDAVTAMLVKSAIMMHEAFKTGCKTLAPLQEQHTKMRQKFFVNKKNQEGQ